MVCSIWSWSSVTDFSTERVANGNDGLTRRISLAVESQASCPEGG